MNNKLVPIEREGKRVLLTVQLAESYETTPEIISNNFNRNKERYEIGKHYFVLEGDALREFKATTHQFDDSFMRVNKLYLWTERGALLHAKSLNTDRAWEVYDRLVETYFRAVEVSESFNMSKELKAIFMLDHRTVDHDRRITALEESMVVDYGQQRTLAAQVNTVVIGALGGTDSPAYQDKNVRGRTYSECNRDIQKWFRVNSRNNIPRKRFDEAVEYIQRWRPSTNMSMIIRQTNLQMKIHK